MLPVNNFWKMSYNFNMKGEKIGNFEQQEDEDFGSESLWLISEQEKAKEPVSDRILDNVYDRICAEPDANYFKDKEHREKLLQRFRERYLVQDDTLKKLSDRFKLRMRQRPEKREYIQETWDKLMGNVVSNTREGTVHQDVDEIFLSPNFLARDYGPLRSLSNYATLQRDNSRAEGENWYDAKETAVRYYKGARRLANFAAKNNGDIFYQEASRFRFNEPGARGQNFLRVNEHQPHLGSYGDSLRCYITADKTKDPGQVFDAWRESLENSPLRDNLFYKFVNRIPAKDYCLKDDMKIIRYDDIVVYKYDNIDDGQFRALLLEFLERCNDKSPELLAADAKKMPATTIKIADGLSVSGNPILMNDYLRVVLGDYSDVSESLSSWTSFVDRMSTLSALVAASRTATDTTRLDANKLRNPAKNVFREFLLLSNINPETMMDKKYGDELPSWTKIC